MKYKCERCGNTVKDKVPSTCPKCGSKNSYKKVKGNK